MKTQISWGWKIALLYIGFVVMILVLVGMSISQKIDLVSDDYYAMELVHQQKIDKIKRSKALENHVKWSLDDKFLEVKFPQDLSRKGISGNIILYCPADNRKDATFPISLDSEAVQKIPRSEIEKGRFHLQVDWAADQVTYWDEGMISIGD